MKNIILVICILFSQTNSVYAEGFLSKIFSSKTDIKEQLDKAHADQEATNRESAALYQEQREIQIRKQEEYNHFKQEQTTQKLKEAQGKPLSITYIHSPANLEAKICSDPQQEANCKFYMAGFSDTITMLFSINPSIGGLCRSTGNLMYEFIQEVHDNQNASQAETHMVLYALLTKNQNCGKTKSPFQYFLSAGSLLDMCHAGDIGFDLCSRYQAGFISALLFLSEETGEPILCGHESWVTSANLTSLLNNTLKADYQLHRNSATEVMLHQLMANMPCPS
ncbi:MAG: hypothetical protein ACAH12_01765 [Methylophilaceae bacterium]